MADECTNSSGSGVIAVVYFVSFVVVSSMMILNLFIGVITSSMQEAKASLSEERDENETATDEDEVCFPPSLVLLTYCLLLGVGGSPTIICSHHLPNPGRDGTNGSLHRMYHRVLPSARYCFQVGLPFGVALPHFVVLSLRPHPPAVDGTTPERAIGAHGSNH